MISSPWLWSHLSFTLLAAAAIGAIVRRKVRGRLKPELQHGDRVKLGLGLVIALAAGGLLSVVPLGEVDLAGYLVAYSGELSFATLFYLMLYVVDASRWQGASLSDRAWRQQWRGPQLAWATMGCVLYASALSGRGPDIYSVGFGPWLAWMALATSAAAAISGRWLSAVLLLGAVGAWQLQLSGASNLWDYAIDPFIFLGSLGQILAAAAGGMIALSRTKRGAERKLAVISAGTLSPAAPETCTYQG